jgi:hypothetical protein
LGLAGIIVLALASMGAATAVADPGAPGLKEASSAVYPNPVVDQNVCPIDMSENSTVDSKRQVAGEETTEECPQVLAESGSGSADEPPSGGDAGGSGEVDEGSLAFTGLSAPTLLAISVLLLGAGLALRRFRPKSSPSPH